MSKSKFIQAQRFVFQIHLIGEKKATTTESVLATLA